MFMEPSYGRKQLLEIVDLFDGRQQIIARERSWAKLMLPQRLIKLKTGKLLPVNYHSMPLGFGSRAKLSIDLEIFQNLAVLPFELDLRFHGDLKLYEIPNTPWADAKRFKEYRACLYELLRLIPFYTTRSGTAYKC